MDEIFLFHGTSDFGSNGILSSNFSLDAHPMTSRTKKMIHGNGIYFSGDVFFIEYHFQSPLNSEIGGYFSKQMHTRYPTFQSIYILN